MRSLVNPITPPLPSIASIDSIHLHWTGALNNTIRAHNIVRSIIVVYIKYYITCIICVSVLYFYAVLRVVKFPRRLAFQTELNETEKTL